MKKRGPPLGPDGLHSLPDQTVKDFDIRRIGLEGGTFKVPHNLRNGLEALPDVLLGMNRQSVVLANEQNREPHDRGRIQTFPENTLLQRTVTEKGACNPAASVSFICKGCADGQGNGAG